MMYEKYMSERLARLRTQKGVSAREMSLSIGQSDNYINTIENKKSLPSMAAFFSICEYLSITPKDFFNEEISDPGLLSEVTVELKRLNSKALEHLLGFIREMSARASGRYI